ncbi:MAG: IS91 family transposase [Lamprobacter sp.]|uniref:IS91 family transposase n=1 Tax=Lamprobacter sp. TaxID=3100796 RepID=UPI002B262D01|nr:IS91 family transposase [Lamprobacter sp.]MEA3641718.1 IS91 family transposase [Lamprobacter sp.]
MILLSSLIATFEADYLAQYGATSLPSQLRALEAMKCCRTSASPRMRVQCEDCGHTEFIPHSCGHRACPHCQHHESQQWIERQLAKQVPGSYFLVTFTVPEALRPLVWSNQKALYDQLIRASWETVRTFTRNDSQLQGEAGAIAVLHTHSRRLDFHPHVHLVMPAAAIDPDKKRWRTKRGKRGYLFNHKALAKVFRAKLLAAISAEGLTLPSGLPGTWVVDCKNVGRGEKALVYLGRYLYRGVIQEKDIVACENGQVTFRYRDAKSERLQYRTLPGARFLALVLQHVLPKGFRRTRNDGFLHPNSKRLIAVLQWLFGLDPKRFIAQLKPRPRLKCPCCEADMLVVQTGLPPRSLQPPLALTLETAETVAM